MKMQGYCRFKYPWDIRYTLPQIADDTEELDPTAFDTKPLDTPLLDAQVDDLIAFGERLESMKEDDNGL